MDGHVHLSALSITATVCVVVLTMFVWSNVSRSLAASDDANKRAWGGAMGTFQN